MLFTCCKADQHANDYIGEYVLQYKDSLTLPLDQESSAFPSYAALFEKDGKELLGCFNLFNNSLYIYELEDRRLLQKIAFEREGPDGIGDNQRVGFYYLDSDSIFLFAFNRQEILHANDQGKVLKRHSLRHIAGKASNGFPNSKTLQPLRIHQGKANIHALSVGQEQHADHTKVHNAFVLDLATGEIGVSVPRPARYNQGFWGPIMKYQSFSCFNRHTQRFVYSLGLDDAIYETDHQGYLKAHPAKYSGFLTPFAPMSKDLSAGLMLDKEAQRRYDYTTPSYFAILYDPYRKLYYRFVTLPQTTEEFKEGLPQRSAVMLLNETFQPVGESLLPHDAGLQFWTMFVGKAGLYICQVPSEENQMRFSIFEPVQKDDL